jgi:transposase
LDHDPPAQRKWTPLGILMIATGALSILFAPWETSDVWVNGLMQWWLHVRQAKGGLGAVKRLVIYLDNGPNNSGRRRQFLKRLIAFADWSGLELRLVYYPPYHSKYNPIERCWSSLEKKWGGTLLTSVEVMLEMATRMRWKGEAPCVQRLREDPSEPAAKISNKEWKEYEARLERSANLPKYDIVIKPKAISR